MISHLRHRFVIPSLWPLGAVCLALALILPDAQAAPPSGKPLTVCTNAPAEGFDNVQYASVASMTLGAMPIFNRLVDFRNGSAELVPSLARAWHISPDGRSITLNLVGGVPFQTTPYFRPTRNFNADDVVFTFERLTQKDHPFNKAYPTPFPFPLDPGFHDNVQRVVRIDDLTVRFDLKRPDSDFIIKLMIPQASIYSAEYAQQLLARGQAKLIDTQPVGTGPFQLEPGYTKTEYRYRAHPDFWQRGLPKSPSLIMRVIPGAEDRMKAVREGRCQVMLFPRQEDVKEALASPTLRTQQAPGLNVSFVAYNLKHPPLDRLEVRQALDMAIDRNGIIQALFKGNVTIANSILPRSLAGFDPAMTNAPYDPEQAKALLQKAGIKPGLELTLMIMPTVGSLNPDPAKLGALLAADWAKIGVKAKLLAVDFETYLARAQKGEFGLIQVDWFADYPSPYNFLGALLTCDAIGGLNFARYCNREFDTLIQSASAERLPRNRAGLYRGAQRLFRRDLPWSTLFHAEDSVVMRKNVSGFQISLLTFLRFEDAKVN